MASCWFNGIGWATSLSPFVALLILEPLPRVPTVFDAVEMGVERPEGGDTTRADDCLVLTEFGIGRDASDRIFLPFEATFGPGFAKDDITA